MFTSDNDFIMIFGILIGLGFIVGSVYWVISEPKNHKKKIKNEVVEII